MKQITLLPEDFNTLDFDSWEFKYQFQEGQDCPMTRALRRVTGQPEIHNCLHTIYYDNGSIKGNQCRVKFVGIQELRDIAKRVAKNGKALFRFGIDIKKALNF